MIKATPIKMLVTIDVIPPINPSISRRLTPTLAACKASFANVLHPLPGVQRHRQCKEQIVPIWAMSL